MYVQPSIGWMEFETHHRYHVSKNKLMNQKSQVEPKKSFFYLLLQPNPKPRPRPKTRSFSRGGRTETERNRVPGVFFDLGDVEGGRGEAGARGRGQ